METKVVTEKKRWDEPRLVDYGSADQITGQQVCKDKFVGTADDFGIVGIRGSEVVGRCN